MSAVEDKLATQGGWRPWPRGCEEALRKDALHLTHGNERFQMSGSGREIAAW